jgi:hypothetical protein
VAVSRGALQCAQYEAPGGMTAEQFVHRSACGAAGAGTGAAKA